MTNNRWTLPLVAVGWLTLTSHVLAEQKSAVSKRSFAALLARRTTNVDPTSTYSTTALPAAIPVHVARSAGVKPLTSASTYGISAATAVVPPSGFGSGRDAFVEALYPQILARPANQSEVDYWARVLASGVHANTVAGAIWNSQEHKSLERSGNAPNIPLVKAYDRAYAVGLANCKERLAAERRREGED